MTENITDDLAAGGSGPDGSDPDAAVLGGPSGFQVHLDVFEGPFDLLLGLISKHKLDITEVALSQVTDEFIAFIRDRSGGWDLDQVSYFLVVAATLLDLKAARLLQYRAYKEVTGVFAGRMAVASRRFPRRVPMEPRFAQLFPEVLLGLGPVEFARIAARALTPRRPPTVSTEHIHAPFVSVREQARRLAVRLRRLGRASFRGLIADCEATYEIVASFLAVLELYREDRVALEQVAPLGDIYVMWNAASDDGDDDVARDADEGTTTATNETGSTAETA